MGALRIVLKIYVVAPVHSKTGPVQFWLEFNKLQYIKIKGKAKNKFNNLTSRSRFSYYQGIAIQILAS